MKRVKATDRVSDFLEIPRDILGSMPKIVITGSGVIHIEGFLGIEEYDTARVTIRIKSGIVAVVGEGLLIDRICEEYIDLKGEIKTVEFL